MVEICDAGRHAQAQHIVFPEVALSLSHYLSDKSFGYALGIDLALDEMRPLKSRIPEESDVRS